MTPEERELYLASIPLSESAHHHAWLRECFAIELKQRLTTSDYDYFETIYHCALLLHSIGDVSDLELLYSAKCSGDMDLGVSFDWQLLFFAEPADLLSHARSIQRPDIAEWTQKYTPDYEDINKHGLNQRFPTIAQTPKTRDLRTTTRKPPTHLTFLNKNIHLRA